MGTKPLAAGSWWGDVRLHAGEHPWTATGFAVALAGLGVLLVASLAEIRAGDHTAAVQYALLGGTAGFVATTLGALPAVLLRSIPVRLEDSMLGLAAGMMLAASSFSLILPGLAAGEQLAGNATAGAALVVLGLALGVLLMLGLDQFTPHEHAKGGPCGPGHERCNRIWLFVLAIGLHNLPEGMAVGVGFAQGDVGVGLPLAVAIALQDIPEGLAVALALRSAGLPAFTAVSVAAVSGLLEPLGALAGVGLSGGFSLAYPVGLGLAAGSMLFVVSHEVIPETHRNGHQTPATIGLMAGFAVMMVLDTTLG